jgi:hypothetical protein
VLTVLAVLTALCQSGQNPHVVGGDNGQRVFESSLGCCSTRNWAFLFLNPFRGRDGLDE